MTIPRIFRSWPVLLLGCLGTAGCASDVGPSAAADAFCERVLGDVDAAMAGIDPPAGDRYGGTAVVGIGQDLAAGLNAFDASDFNSVQTQQFVALMTLVRLDENLEFEPYLAESWEFANGGTELTFRLRDDVLWHDGTPTTAEDVAFTYRRVTDPTVGFPNRQYWTYYEGVEVLDARTVRFRIRPHADVLDPWRALAIMPKHLLEDVPPEELANHPFGRRCPVGNGPFRFEDHRDGQQWTFAANPAFPEALGGRPFLDRLVMRVVAEQSSLLTELLTGGIDVYLEANPEQTGRIAAADNLSVQGFEGRSYSYIAWNLKDERFTDQRVREAFAHAIDRQGMVDALLEGHGVVAYSSVPPYHWAYDPPADLFPYDPARASRLLDEAGWVDRDGDGVREKNGTRLAFTLITNQGSQVKADALQVVQAQLRTVGVEVATETVEFGTFIDQLVNRDFEAAIGTWITDFKHDDWTTFHGDAVDAPYGWGAIEDQELASYLDTLMLIPEREPARPLWSAYQRRLAELQPYTFLYFTDRNNGINNRLHDVLTDVRGDLVNVNRWWIPDSERRLRSE